MYVIAGYGLQGKAVVAYMLQHTNDPIHVYDPYVEGDPSLNSVTFWPTPLMVAPTGGPGTIISTLRPKQNLVLARSCAAQGWNYVDLGGDTNVTKDILSLSAGNRCTLVPDCGVAPGLVSSWAGDAVRNGSKKLSVACGGIPANRPDYEPRYIKTFSTEGLVAEYSGTCQVIYNGKAVTLPTLSDKELYDGSDDQWYEMDLTSGSTSLLVPWLISKGVQEFSYKTIRYHGHYQWLKDCVLWQENPSEVLEKVLPTEGDDKVILDCRSENDNWCRTWERIGEFSAMQQATGYTAAKVAIMCQEGTLPRKVVQMHEIELVRLV